MIEDKIDGTNVWDTLANGKKSPRTEVWLNNITLKHNCETQKNQHHFLPTFSQFHCFKYSQQLDYELEISDHEQKFSKCKSTNRSKLYHYYYYYYYYYYCVSTQFCFQCKHDPTSKPIALN